MPTASTSETTVRRQSIAETRLLDAQQLAAQHGLQLADLFRQRDTLQARVKQVTGELATVAARLRQQEAAATVERETEAQRLRAIEDRSHHEIDRARQETRDLRTQLTVLEREHGVRERQRDEARAAVTTAQREAASQQARSDALEQQLARLGDLHSALQATLAKGAEAPAKRGPPRKTAAVSRKGRPKGAPVRLPAKR